MLVEKLKDYRYNQILVIYLSLEVRNMQGVVFGRLKPCNYLILFFIINNYILHINPSFKDQLFNY